MPEVTNELMYELLKRIQSGMTHQDRMLKELRDRIASLETIRADIVRIDHRLDAMDDRLERIEKRLDLVDA
jgi:4-hydroxy-3-methylbut-2-en-1-yl diphosphate synthase IspG/GcpE